MDVFPYLHTLYTCIHNSLHDCGTCICLQHPAKQVTQILSWARSPGTALFTSNSKNEVTRSRQRNSKSICQSPSASLLEQTANQLPETARNRQKPLRYLSNASKDTKRNCSEATSTKRPSIHWGSASACAWRSLLFTLTSLTIVDIILIILIILIYFNHFGMIWLWSWSPCSRVRPNLRFVTHLTKLQHRSRLKNTSRIQNGPYGLDSTLSDYLSWLRRICFFHFSKNILESEIDSAPNRCKLGDKGYESEAFKYIVFKQYHRRGKHQEQNGTPLSNQPVAWKNSSELPLGRPSFTITTWKQASGEGEHKCAQDQGFTTPIHTVRIRRTSMTHATTNSPRAAQHR